MIIEATVHDRHEPVDLSDAHPGTAQDKVQPHPQGIFVSYDVLDLPVWFRSDEHSAAGWAPDVGAQSGVVMEVAIRSALRLLAPAASAMAEWVASGPRRRGRPRGPSGRSAPNRVPFLAMGAAVIAALTASLLGIDGVVVSDGTPEMQLAKGRMATCTSIARSIRLVVKSRRRLVREAICGYLAQQPGFSVVGHATSVDVLAELCTLRRPDVALVDAVELTVSKMEVLRQVRSTVPGTELVVTYTEVAPQALEMAAASGITQLVPSSRGLDAVLRRVRACAQPAGRQRPDGLALTEYDVQLVSLLSLGRSVRDMADVLQVSTRTVENHKRRLYAKLGVGNSGHAVTRAVSLGVIGLPPAEPPSPQERRPPLVVVHGQDRAGADAVMRALIAARLPVVRTRTAGQPGRDHWASWQRGPIVVVLVDPTYDDWLVPATLGAHPVVVLTAEPDLPTFVDMLLRGARALMQAEDVGTDLVSVLSAVVMGYVVVDAAPADHVAGWMAVRLAAGSSAVPVLTRREHDILGLLARGHTIRQTAQALGVTAKTVENAQGHLFRKLGAHNRAEALALAYRLGMLDLDS